MQACSPPANGDRSMPRDIELRRIYDDRGHDDAAYRVLVDRLWPRGLTKADAGLDDWLRDVAPSTDLRRWYAHDPTKFAAFAARYRAELQRPPAADAVARLIDIAGGQPVVLLTATRDVEHSAALVLHALLTA